MNYVDCPTDATHLKAAGRPIGNRPLLLRCTTCGKSYEFAAGVLTETAPDAGESKS